MAVQRAGEMDHPDGEDQGGEVTALLAQLGKGNEEAASKLIPLVYKELRRLAGAYMRRERIDHTLQPKALVHEAYIKLVQQHSIDWHSRAHFFGIAGNLNEDSQARLEYGQSLAPRRAESKPWRRKRTTGRQIKHCLKLPWRRIRRQ